MIGQEKQCKYQVITKTIDWLQGSEYGSVYIVNVFWIMHPIHRNLAPDMFSSAFIRTMKGSPCCIDFKWSCLHIHSRFVTDKIQQWDMR